MSLKTENQRINPTNPGSAVKENSLKSINHSFNVV